MRSSLVVACLGAALLGGCSYPDLRNAVYSSIGPTAIYLEPPRAVPDKGGNNYAANRYLIPGSLIWPRNIEAADPFSMRAEKWGSKSSLYCAPRSAIYTLDDLGRGTPIPDIAIEYSFDLSMETLASSVMQLRLDRALLVATNNSTALRADAAAELKLSDNDIRYLQKVKINIRNIEVYEATPRQLEAAKRDILKKCRLPGLANYRQIERIYAGDIDFELELASGAALNVELVRAGLRKRFMYTQSGKALFFAAVPVN